MEGEAMLFLHPNDRQNLRELIGDLSLGLLSLSFWKCIQTPMHRHTEGPQNRRVSWHTYTYLLATRFFHGSGPAKREK